MKCSNKRKSHKKSVWGCLQCEQELRADCGAQIDIWLIKKRHVIKANIEQCGVSQTIIIKQKNWAKNGKNFRHCNIRLKLNKNRFFQTYSIPKEVCVRLVSLQRKWTPTRPKKSKRKTTQMESVEKIFLRIRKGEISRNGKRRCEHDGVWQSAIHTKSAKYDSKCRHSTGTLPKQQAKQINRLNKLKKEKKTRTNSNRGFLSSTLVLSFYFL